MLLGIGAVGAGAFVVVFLLDGWTRPGYSSVRHPVSALALGSRGWLQTANFIICGSATCLGAAGVLFAGQSIWLGWVLVVFGLSLAASGIFPMDPMRGYPPGAPHGDPDTFSRHHTLHDYAGMLVFGTLPAAAAISAVVLPWGMMRIASAAVAVGLVAGFVAFGRAWESGSPRAGVIQKVMITAGWLWLAAVFVAFL